MQPTRVRSTIAMLMAATSMASAAQVLGAAAVTDEIVVVGRKVDGYRQREASTATKTDTPLHEIPQSVQIISEQVLIDQLVVRLGEALENVSGVQASGTNNTGLVDLFTVRGFPLNVSGNFYKNGRPFVFSVQPPTESLEKIEFLKGPSSVLYGQAEPGGIVSMVLKKPTDAPMLKTTVQAGSYQFAKAVIDASTPVGDTLGVRVGGSQANAESFRDFQDTRQSVLTGTVQWEPIAWLSASANASYQSRDQLADSGLTAGPAEEGQDPGINAGFGDRVVDVPIGRSLNEPWTDLDVDAKEAGYDLRIQPTEALQFRHSFNWQRQETDELRADPQTISPVDVPSAGITRGDLSRTFRDRHTERRSTYIEASVFAKVDTGPVGHKILIGTDLFESPAGFTEYLPVFGDPRDFNVFSPEYQVAPPPQLGATLFALRRSELEQFGVYVQTQMELWEQWHILVGARRDRFTDKLENSFFVGEGQLDNFVALDQTESDTTYRGGLLYEFAEQSSLFVSYSQGFKPNLDPFAESQLDPEQSDQWEVGAKLSLLNDAVLATITLFDLRKENVVIVNPVSQVLNVAGERGAKGVEVDMVAEFGEAWNVVLNYAYLDAEVLAGDPRALGTPGVGTRDLTGNVPPSSPTHSAKFWMTYQAQSDRWLGFRAGGGVFTRSSVQGDIFNTLQHPGYARVDAMIGWAGAIGDTGVDVQLNLKNVLDREYFDGSSRNFIRPGEPFTVLGQVSFTF